LAPIRTKGGRSLISTKQVNKNIYQHFIFPPPFLFSIFDFFFLFSTKKGKRKRREKNKKKPKKQC
ncbi:hypothetical protein, partial [Lactobacillus delbrueckii]|uniref:hypothetical protein n=1 Tax=Lactobacillus delbrueckii TaxID=1584 RepID=UPI0030FE1012